MEESMFGLTEGRNGRWILISRSFLASGAKREKKTKSTQQVAAQTI
jgi:hypothetical protein